MTEHNTWFTRRTLLAGATALLSTASSHAAANKQRSALNIKEPTSALRAYRKVLFANHEDLVCWWMKGTKYGMVDNRTTPLYGMEIATLLRCRNIATDCFEVSSLEIVYYTDLASGRLLQRWQNPYTNEWLDMKYVPVGPTKVPYSIAGPEMPKALPGVKIESQQRMGPITVANDDVWIRNDSDASVTRDSGGDAKPFLVHDWATYHASLSDIENPAVASAPADVSFLDLTSWPRSMKMGERTGTRMSRAAGRKVSGRDEMPQSFLALLASQHPNIYKDPSAALETSANRFER